MIQKHKARLPQYCTRLRTQNPTFPQDDVLFLCTRKQISLYYDLLWQHPDLEEIRVNIPVEIMEGLFLREYITDFILDINGKKEVFLLNQGNKDRIISLTDYWEKQNVCCHLVDPDSLSNIRTNNIRKILYYKEFYGLDPTFDKSENSTQEVINNRNQALDYIVHAARSTKRSIIRIARDCEQQFNLREGFGINLYYYLLANHMITEDIDSGPLNLVRERTPEITRIRLDDISNISPVSIVRHNPVDRCVIGTMLISNSILYCIAAAEPDTIWLIPMDRDCKLPFPITRDKLCQGIQTHLWDFCLICNPVEPAYSSEEAREKALKERDLWINAFGDALTDTRIVTNKEFRKKAVRHAVSFLREKDGQTQEALRQKVRRHLIRYWQYGSDVDAFLPQYNHVGRKSNANVLGDYATDAMDAAIQKYLLRTDPWTQQRAYNQMLLDFYPGHAEYGPTIHQFKYRLKLYRTLHPGKYALARDGKLDYPLTDREALGQADYGMPGPGSVYMIDATRLDYYIVDRDDRTKVIGRPTLFLMVDVFSRAIVGMYLSIESESIAIARMLLYSTFTNKADYCRALQINITEEEWPYCYIPQQIKCDNSEMKSRHLDGMVRELGAAIESLLQMRPDTKPYVETKFHLVNTILGPMINGHVLKRKEGQLAKGTVSRKAAALTLTELREIIVRCIIWYNNCHVLTDYDIAPDMADLSMKLTPAGLWNWGILHRSGVLRRTSPVRIYASLLPSCDAKITYKGMLFKYKKYYTCKEAESREWFADRRGKRTDETKKVYYNPDDMSCIYYLPTAEELEGTDDPVIWKMTIPKEEGLTYKGRSEVETKQLYELQKEKEKTLSEQYRDAELLLQEQIIYMLANANKQKKCLLKEGRTASVYTLKRNAQNELYEEEQEKNAINPLNTMDTSSSGSV